MGSRNVRLLLISLSLVIAQSAADWNILRLKWSRKSNIIIANAGEDDNDGLLIRGRSLKNYCESWRMNVELNNIRRFDVVPEECAEYIGKYMASTQYKVDSERALEECTLYLASCCASKCVDGKDAWIFDVDDTLLSTLPYYQKHNYGGEMLNVTSLEAWMREGNAPALGHTLRLFNDIKARGFKIFIVSSRRELLRSATVDNLIKVGYQGWTSLILRSVRDEYEEVQKYKAEVRKRLISDGYRIHGVVGDQWSSLKGTPNAERTFKLPNSLYYVA
ncbi:acid phosphatase 1-like [Malania oleifera]|uniref:acid phosphatase 1-like n=1 Tax=Malania oleifera TaxID=397392 RepID=UPI0025AE1D4E|nr:acid phosphatase 1-like [Malania oleifera]